MSRLRDMRKRNQRAAMWAPICSNCGQRGKHFVPPSLGDRGFYACEPSQTSARVDDLPADRRSEVSAHCPSDDGL